jgi:predicted XRE-type DNA-binding protein
MAYPAYMAENDGRHVQFNEREVRGLFKRWVEGQVSQRKAAEKLKVTVGYVNDMLTARRKLNDAALKKIGVRRTVKEVYETR